jgi:hypothetical protein
MAPLERIETRKDTLQVAIESGATHLGQIVGIVAGAVRDVTRELGDWATDIFEMREAAKRAEADDRERRPVSAGELEPRQRGLSRHEADTSA